MYVLTSSIHGKWGDGGEEGGGGEASARSCSGGPSTFISLRMLYIYFYLRLYVYLCCNSISIYSSYPPASWSSKLSQAFPLDLSQCKYLYLLCFWPSIYYGFLYFCMSGILFLYMPVSASPSYLIPARPSSEHISLFSSDSLALLRFHHNSNCLTLLFSYSRNCLALAENAVKAAYTPKALLGRLNKNCNEW